MSSTISNANPSGNLVLDSNTPGTGKSSLNVGGSLNLAVGGDFKTAGGTPNVGGAFSLNAASASAPISIDNIGPVLNVNLSGQHVAAFTDHDRRYVVIGNRSHTAVIIDGRVAGGDPRYYTLLDGLEGDVAKGVVDGPLPVPYVFNVFTAPFYTMDMPVDGPAGLGQSYQSEAAGTIDPGEDMPEADATLSIPGLPKNSTIFFGTSNDGKKDEAKKDGSVAML